jgi:hypothetical protein
LQKVVDLLARKVAEKGGHTQPNMLPAGTGKALLEAVSATEAGREWISIRASAGERLLSMVRVANAYGLEGVNPAAGLTAHTEFLLFDDRAELIRRFPTWSQAAAKARALRAGLHDVQAEKTEVPRTQVNQLAIRTGVSTREARTILRALMEGRSKTKLIRAVNQAAEMVEKDQRHLKAAA